MDLYRMHVTLTRIEPPIWRRTELFEPVWQAKICQRSGLRVIHSKLDDEHPQSDGNVG